MNIRDFFEREMAGLDTELRKLPASGRTPLEHLREEMYLIRNCQQRVHEYVQSHPFAGEAEEIDYHKYRYPQLRALHIFRVEVYLIRKDLPPLARQVKRLTMPNNCTCCSPISAAMSSSTVISS